MTWRRNTNIRTGKIELKDIVIHLKSTRDKLIRELGRKEKDMKALQGKIRLLKGNKAELESEKHILNEQLKNLDQEKKHMNNSLEKTNDILMRLKYEVAQFDEEIRK